MDMREAACRLPVWSADLLGDADVLEDDRPAGLLVVEELRDGSAGEIGVL
jgi:hypothetical protein